MNPEQFHDDVGAASFDFCHRDGGTLTRFGFTVMAGDNPDFWKARMLMPGAEFKGVIHAVFEFDDGAVQTLSGYQPWYAYVDAGRSTFKIRLMARDAAQFRKMCGEIGALREWGKPLSRWYRLKCVVRYLWERRPVIRLRGPLDIFD